MSEKVLKQMDRVNVLTELLEEKKHKRIMHQISGIAVLTQELEELTDIYIEERAKDNISNQNPTVALTDIRKYAALIEAEIIRLQNMIQGGQLNENN